MGYRGASARTWLAGLLCCLLVCCAVAAMGAEYYVDGAGGSDDGTGAATDPFLTVNRALREASGDDTISIRPGVYHESIMLVAPSQQGIHLVGVVEGEHWPVLRSTDAGSHVIVAKDFTGSIENLEITGATDAIGVNLIGDDNGVTTGRVIGCRIHGNRIGVHLMTVGGSRSCDPLVQGNVIYDNSTRGIGFMDNATGVAEGNDIYDNGSGLIDSSGIGISGNAAPTIVNNTIHGNSNAGISIRDHAAPVILHNTITHHDVDGDTVVGTAIRVQQNGGIDFLDIRNNIIAWNIHGLVSQGGRSCSGNRYNLVWQNSGTDYTGFAAGPGHLAADPGLVNPVAGDFHLRSGSACIDAAEPVAGVVHDMDGDSRPMGDGPDIGADEFRPASVPPGGGTGDDGQEPAAIRLQPVYMLLLR